MADAGRGRAAWGEAARPFIVGNWKMWGPRAALAEIDAIAAAARAHPEVEVALCLPATLIDATRAHAFGLAIGGQDCHAEPEGAFTGSISAGLLHDAGASLVLLGHSERRRLCGERDADVRAKLRTVRSAGLAAIVCVGEPAEARGHAAEYVRRQLIETLEGATPEGLTIAYEPVWAIGTGRAADTGAIGAIHGTIRGCLQAIFGEAHRQIGILYGGSVDPENASPILAANEVAGVLVGTASRSARTFAPIVASAAALEHPMRLPNASTKTR